VDVIWHKVWRDLAHNKARTALVVLSVAVGVFALGVVFGARGVIDVYLARENEFSQAANVTFKGDRLGRQTVEAALREPGVANAEIETVAPIRWRLPDETEWQQGVLVAREDYASQQVSRVELLEGNWPGESADPEREAPGAFTLAVERQTSGYFGIPLGASIIVESRPGELASIDGVLRKPYVMPPLFGVPATFYATPETITRLAGVRDPNKLYVRLAPSGSERLDEVRERVKDRLERMGLSVSGSTATGTEDEILVDLLDDQLDATFLVLGVLGIALLGVSAFLIVNTMNGIVVQQVWQIGVMKVLGATSWRVVRVYLSMALTFGVLALLPAIPLGALGAHAWAGWMAGFFNIIATDGFQVSPVAVVVQIMMAVAVVLLAAAVPVIGGARTSPHACLSTYGLGGGFGRGPLDRLVGQVRFLPRPVTLSLRNAFRRKMRVALTLLAFVLVGVMFIGVLSARSSVHSSIEVMLESFSYDAMASLSRYYRADRLVEVTESVPGTTRVEVWDQVVADLSLRAGERDILVSGVPPDSETFRPRLAAGRDLLPEDGRAILLDSLIATEEGIGVGDEVTLTIAGRESTWTVVGLLVMTRRADPVDNYVPFGALTREAGHAHRGNTVVVMSEAHDAPSQERLVADLGDVYAAQRIETAKLQSADDLRQMIYTSFDAFSYLLLTMAFLLAVVGGVGLAGTLSINVIERMREIGIMRAVGALTSAIFGIFVGEGMSVGVLSWLLAVPLSYPGARLFSRALGLAIFQTELEFRYSVPSVVVWLVIVTALSALASLWPAWRATRVSVREALAYE
jgi:putative ABC transport system permease protein